MEQLRLESPEEAFAGCVIRRTVLCATSSESVWQTAYARAILASDSARRDPSELPAAPCSQLLIRCAESSMVLTSSASGRVPIDQLTTRPSKQSMTGDRYTLPAGIWNSVRSVSHFWFGSGRVEVAIDDVLRRRANFSAIGAVATSPGRGSGQTFLSHQTTHYLLRDEDPSA